MFERFISPARLDMPDIDMDFEDARRGEIVEYLRQKYGHDKVSQIATLGRLSGKAVVKDVARVFEVPFFEANQVTEEILERSAGDERVHKCVEDSFAESERLKSFDARFPEVKRHAMFLEGMAKTVGIHAAGVVTSPVPLMDIVPLETRKQKDSGEDATIVTAVDMRGAQALGLLKLDVLGLRNLTVLREAVAAVREAHPKHAELDLERLDLDDKETLHGFTEGDFVGVFQFDSPAARRVCSGVTFTNFEDIATMTALNRPGTSRSGLTEVYKARKAKGEIGKDHFHPKITAITSDTLGVMVYQEHIMRIAVDVAGYSPGDADKLRKTIGKRLGEEALNREREHFVTGCLTYTPDMDRAVAEKLMDAIAKAGAYLFNKSHATAYGVIAYWCMWLKCHFPIEFYWALLCNERDDVVMRRIARDAEKHGIRVLPPDVNVSRERFVIDRKERAIRGSILDIKFVGEEAAKAIIAAQPFVDFLDFARRVPRQKVNKRAVESLTQAGAMNALVPNPRWLWAQIDDVWDLAGKAFGETKNAPLKLAELERKIEGSKTGWVWTPEEAAVAAAEVNPFFIHGHPIEVMLPFVRDHVKGAEVFELDDLELWDQKHVLVAVRLLEMRERFVGENMKDREKLSEADKERMGFGRPFVQLVCDDASGREMKVRVDQHLAPHLDSMLREVKPGGFLLVYGHPDREWQTIDADYVVNLGALSQRHAKGEQLNVWERIAVGRHPAIEYPWRTEAERKAALSWKQKKAFEATGIVAHVREKRDKKSRLMAWFKLIGANLTIEVVSFGSSWSSFREHLRMGELVTLKLEEMRDGGVVLDHERGGVKLRRRSLSGKEIVTA
jgi:DNA polymerase-3 subunit alpha